MKAVMKVAPGIGKVEVRDIPEPHTAHDQVKIRVHAAGICGTDLHIYKDEFKTCPPVVLGHEISGELVEVGAGVQGIPIGTRVTTETYFSTCGSCRYCRVGESNLCPLRRSIGSAVDGGFTNYLVVPARNVHPLPDSVSYRAGALTEPLACVVHAVLSTPTVTIGDVAVIAGPGTIGLLTLQVIKSLSATVVVLGTNADKKRLALAKELGADHAINIQEEDPKALIHEISHEGFGADVVYECSGASPAATQLLELVRRRGRYVQIGLFGKPVSWDLDQICYKELVVTGSNASVPSAWLRALKLLGSGTVRAESIITDTFCVLDWEEAFHQFENRSGVKILLTPAT